MRCILILILLISSCFALKAQQYFPVKIDKKWGLINTDGKVVLQPNYDAIGEFKRYGYAVMQRNGGVGLLNEFGREIIPPKYDDLKVLDSTLIAVMDFGEWMVINLDGKVILKKGYERVHLWNGGLLAFMEFEKWGIVDRDGNLIVAPQYDEIRLEKDQYFLTYKGDKLGLLSRSGKEILPNISQEIKIFNDELIFYQKGNFWGGVDHQGKDLIPPKYDSFKRISDNFIKLHTKRRFHLFSMPCSKIITHNNYDEYYAFSSRHIIGKKDRQLGLLDWCGNMVLPPKYAEIQAYDGDWYRVNYQGLWGIISGAGEVIIPFKYDYIAPLRGNICVVKKGSDFGIVNFKGKEIVAPAYNRIELDGNKAKAYYRKQQFSKEESLTLLEFDQEGKLLSNSNFDNHFQIKIAGKNSANQISGEQDIDYQLDDFEWFYSPETDRWGLRKLSDGSVQIEPTFHSIQVEKNLGLTIVGIEKYTKYEFERTTYRFEMIYGLVVNEVGLLVTDVDFWDIRLEDFEQGYSVARCIFSDGKYGLVDKIGRIVRKDFAYIGPFEEGGIAKASLRGRLSGSLKRERSLGDLQGYLSKLLSPNYMVDYTQYDQIFRKDAVLVCDNCEWGYIDTSGTVIIPPQYTFAREMVNDVGIVECDGKWGMINKLGETLIPCRYDQVEFLENTDHKIIRIYVQRPKYGLIDTLGQLAVNAIYDEIGTVNEGRLAVKRNGLWGFVNHKGIEVIPCRFREVAAFSGGLAAVKLGQYWGYIDKQGEVEIDFKYKRAGNFSEGLSWVYTDEGIGYIDTTENFIIQPQFQKANDFEFGVARVAVEDKFGLINKQGNFIQKPYYPEIGAFNQYGLAIVRTGKDRFRYGIINTEGEQVTKPVYKGIKPFREGMAAVKYKDKYGFIDTTGHLIIKAIYSKVSSFSEGKAAVTKNGTCGYINKTGGEVVKFQFSKCLDFDEGKAVVYRGIRKAGLVNDKGAFVFRPSLNRLLNFQEGRGLMRDNNYRFYFITEQASLYNGFYQKASAFRHGVALVQINGKWGIINQRGIELIPPKYDKIDAFQNGYAKVRIEGFTGLSNLKGELIVSPDYESISYAGKGLFRVEQGDKVGYFDTEGKWVWDLDK